MRLWYDPEGVVSAVQWTTVQCKYEVQSAVYAYAVMNYNKYQVRVARQRTKVGISRA